MGGEIRIGISGWRYAGWRGVFYPPKLPQRRELEFAAERFRSIEINGTHYSLQRPEFFARWAEETPDEFVFAVKGSRFITHMKKLREIDDALANFFAQGVLRLGRKLGPILWQFPPRQAFDCATMERFFRQLPRTMGAAGRLAQAHDARLRGRAWTEVERGCARLPLRHCVEIRHESFAVPEFVALLRKHTVGLVVADTVEWPLLMDVTADFVYCRLHGSEQLYASGYDDVALEVWAKRVKAWARGEDSPNGRFACAERCEKRERRDVYVYFDNDMKVRAPYDAMQLRKLVE
ncbi:MAG: DUF72 domain-containing protein [Acidobacteriaceae bacterium]